MTGVMTRERFGQRHTQVAEAGVMQPQATGHQDSPSATKVRKRQSASLLMSEDVWPC
jgi:hypothetical protein